MSEYEPIPLRFAETVAEELAAILRPHCHRLLVVGSVRRGRMQVSDVELLIIPKTVKETPGAPSLFGGDEVEVLPAHDAIARSYPRVYPVSHRHPGEGDSNWPGKRISGAARWWKLNYVAPNGQDVLADIFLATPETWGVMAVIRTGPAEFSKWLVTHWIHHSGGGRVVGGQLHPPTDKLHDYHRFHKGQRLGEPLATPEEKDVFEACNLPYLEPEDRDDWYRLKAVVAARGGER